MHTRLLSLLPAAGERPGFTRKPLERAISAALLASALVAPAALATPWGHEQVLTTDDRAASDFLGISVATEGDVLIAGAYGDDDLGDRSGAAYLFTRGADGLWTQHSKLKADDGAAGDWFGWTVATAGDSVAMGAYNHDHHGNSSGAVYLFVRGGDGNWTQLPELSADDAAAGDRFGKVLALQGDTLVVGAAYNDDLHTDTGSVYVFTRDGAGNWSQLQKLNASDAAQADNFGSSVALDGDTLVVGAQWDDDQGDLSGSTYVFTLNGQGLWVEQAKLVASDGQAQDYFGIGVAISGDVIAVSSIGDDNLGSGSGSVYIFRRDASDNWSQQQHLTASDGAANDKFGQSLALRGDRLLVGASEDDDGSSNSGSVYLFASDAAGNWTEQSKFNASDAGQDDYLGASLAVSDQALVIGADGYDSTAAETGAVYVLENSTELALVKTHDAALGNDNSTHYIADGATLTYTLSATNNDAESAANTVLIRDVLPAGTSLVSATATPASGQCAESAGTVTCSFDEIAANGGQARADIAVTVAGASDTTIVNSASIGAWENDSNTLNNNDSIAVTLNSLPQAQSLIGAARLIAQRNGPAITGLLSGSDADGDSLNFALDAAPAAANKSPAQPTNLGVVTVDLQTGAYSYTPNTDAHGVDSFAFRVHDGKQYSSSASVEVYIQHAAPQIGAIPAQQVDEDVSTSALAVSVSDDVTPAGSIVVSASSDNPQLVPSDAQHLILAGSDGERTLTVVPLADQHGSVNITVTASDGELQSQVTFALSVAPVNDAPTITAQTPLSTDEEIALNIELGNLLVSDVDSLFPSDFSLSVADGDNYQRSGNSIVPAQDFVGTLSIPVTVNDGALDSAAFDLQVQVSNLNDAPVFSSGVPASAQQGRAFSHSVQASDVDAGQSLRITAPTLPDWLTLTDHQDGSATLASKAGRPNDQDVGSHAVLLRVTDDAATAAFAEQSFDLSVADVNDLPSISKLADVQIDEDSSTSALSFSVSDNEVAAADLQISVSSSNTALVPNDASHLQLGGSGANRSLSVQPLANQHGSTVITVSVSDGDLSSSETFTLTVNSVNDAPSISGTPQISAVQGVAYSFTPSASDLDADPLSFSIDAKPSWASFDSASGALSGTPGAAHVGAHGGIVIRVSDGHGGIAALPAFAIAVANTNDAPSATSATASVDEDGSVAFSPAVTDADAGDSHSFSVLSQPGHGSASVNAEGQLVYTPAANFNGSDSFSYRATDSAGAHVDGSATITVNPLNDAPSLSSTANGLLLKVGETLSVELTGSDIDGDPLSYAAAASNYGTASFTAGTLSFTASAATPAGETESLSVTLSDGHGGEDSLVLPLRVNAADVADANGDGVSDAQAAAAGLDPNLQGGDSDGDGKPDATEIGDASKPTDSDGDGVIDALEGSAGEQDASVLGFTVPASTASALGLPDLGGQVVTLSAAPGQTLTAHVNGSTGLPLMDEAAAGAANAGLADGQYSFPLGLLDFSVTTGGAATTTVTLSLPSGVSIPDNAVVRKLTVDGSWQTYPETKAVLDRTANTLTLTLEDNDGVFDLDPAAGVIRDPVGVAVASSSDSGSGGSGGSGSASPWALLALPMLALIGRLRRRR